MKSPKVTLQPFDPREKRFVERYLGRFWTKVGGDLEDPTACWPWTGRRSWDGTGVFRAAGRELSAHRLAWAWFHDKPLFPDLAIRHRCADKACCNPHHLYVAMRTGPAGVFAEIDFAAFEARLGLGPRRACRALLARLRKEKAPSLP